MTTIGVIRTLGMAAIVSLCAASCKPHPLCMLATGGDWFPVEVFSDVSSSAAAEPGSLTCGVVYRIDKRDYVVGGCNRSSVGLWAKQEGRIGGTGPSGRRQLICRE
jgi:hypothetical protein